MKVVHVLKRLETIDEDIKDLRKLEKQITRNKSFTSPIYITIEKQINILLGERIKLMDLRIENPPAEMVSRIEGAAPAPPAEKEVTPKPKAKSTARTSKPKKEARAEKPAESIDDDDEDDIPMMTQDIIDARINEIQGELKKDKKQTETRQAGSGDDVDLDDPNVKILDIALEHGSLARKSEEKEKKVRFFRENFPSE